MDNRFPLDSGEAICLFRMLLGRPMPGIGVSFSNLITDQAGYFQSVLEARAFDIIQPDVTKVGGISEERRIGWMAQEHGVRFIPHGWNTAVGLAADLQLASAFPGTDLIEYLTGSPFIDEITAGGWHLDGDGMLAIPSKPGLGLTLDPDAVKKYTRGERLLE